MMFEPYQLSIDIVHQIKSSLQTFKQTSTAWMSQMGAFIRAAVSFSFIAFLSFVFDRTL